MIELATTFAFFIDLIFKVMENYIVVGVNPQ